MNKIGRFVGRCDNCGKAIYDREQRYYVRLFRDDYRRIEHLIMCSDCVMELKPTVVKDESENS